MPTPIRRRPADELLTAAESPEDFRHRMLANAAALVFTVVLIVVGFWLATSIADMRRAPNGKADYTLLRSIATEELGTDT